MAKKIDTSNLSVDYKQLMRMTVQDRVGLAKSGLGEELMQSLTPTQLALAFPKYYARQLPDIGRVITGGGAAPTYGGTAPSYGGGRPSQTAAPVSSAPSGRQNPQSSSAAKENQQNEFLNEIRRQVQERQQQGTNLRFTSSTKINATAYSPRAGGSVMEGDYRSSRPGPGQGKQGYVNTLADYASGRASYVTVAGNPNMYNKSFIIPEISFYDKNGDLKTLRNVPVVVHDTGSAFKNAPSNRFDIPIDKDASNEMMSKSHSLWSKQGITFNETETPTGRQSGSTGIIPQDASKSQSGATTGLRSGVSGAESESQLIERGAGVRGFTYAGREKGGGECVKGSQGVLGALLGDTKKFSQQIGHRAAGSMTLDGGNNYLSGTGYFNSPSQMTSDYLKDPKQWRIGDTVVAQGGGRGLGHIQVWNGKAWVSDFKQTGILVNNYSGHTLYRLNNDALSRLHPNYLKQMDGNGATSSYMSVNRINPGESSTVGTDKEATPFSTQTEEIKKPSNYDSWPKPLQDYLKRNPDIEKEIFNAHALGVPVLDAFNKAYESNPKIFEQSSEATADLVKTITNTPPGELPKLSEELKYGFWKEGSTPTSEERKQVFEKGGVVVNLDTNWAKKGQQTGPMIVIPDNATDEQRKQAQAYIRQIEEVYKEKFGKSLPGKVVTRSENEALQPNRPNFSGGRTATIHSEPFSVNDDKAVEYFTRTNEGRAKLANITANTLGKIPGVQFSLPHDPYKPMKPDYGAVGAMGSEVDLARVLINDLKQKQIIQREAAKEKVVRETQVPPTQTQQGQALVPAEAVAAPSPQQLESQKPTGQQGQGASISPTRAGVSASPIKQPTATPEGYRTLEQRPTDTAGPAQKLPDTGTTEAQKVNLEQSAPPTEPGKYGGGEITDLRPNEDAYVVQAKTGQVVAQMNSKQEILAGNEVIPTRRIDNIRTEMQNDSRNIQQEQPQQQSNQPVASMTPSTQMTQTQPNMYNDTNQIYREMSASIYNKPASVDAAYRMARLQSNPTRDNIDVGNIGYNTLT